MTEPDWLAEYRDVNERITIFDEKYPDGSLQGSWKVKQVGEQLFVVYKAFAYRTPTDHKPGQGNAWEPFPGKSAYTKDSELMNAETAAWGRALVAIGIVASRKIASKQEVLARQGAPDAAQEPAEPKPKVPSKGRAFASEKQREHIKQLISEYKVTRMELAGILDQWDQQLTEGWLNRLTGGAHGTASRLIDTLEKLGKPQVDA